MRALQQIRFVKNFPLAKGDLQLTVAGFGNVTVSSTAETSTTETTSTPMSLSSEGKSENTMKLSSMTFSADRLKMWSS